MRRKNNNESPLSLDSLMDTLTNVVGILVMLLVVTQLGVGEAVRKIYAALPEVTAEELAEAKRESEELKKLLSDLEGGLDPQELVRRDRNDLESRKKLIAELQVALEKTRVSETDLAAMEAELEQKQKEVKELENEIASASKELASVKAKLDETPEPKTPPPIAITLPNPRPAPPGTTPIEFACQGGRLRPLDVTRLREAAITEIEKVTGGNYEGGLDCEKMTKHFEENNVGDNYYRLKFQSIRGDPYVNLEARPDQGVDIKEMVAANSRYTQRLREINRRQHYLNFRVWSDSFDTYMVARAVASQQYRFAAGWLPVDKSYVYRIRVNLPGGVRCKGAPPPPPPPPPPKNPKPKPPPPPINQID